MYHRMKTQNGGKTRATETNLPNHCQYVRGPTFSIMREVVVVVISHEVVDAHAGSVPLVGSCRQGFNEWKPLAEKRRHDMYDACAGRKR